MDIIDQIDHALHDFAVSKDAMRWDPNPPPDPATFTMAGFDAALIVVDEIHLWDDAQRWALVELLQPAWAEAVRRVNAVMADVRAACDQVGRQFESFGRAWLNTGMATAPMRRVDVRREQRVATMMRRRQRRAYRNAKPFPPLEPIGPYLAMIDEYNERLYADFRPRFITVIDS